MREFIVFAVAKKHQGCTVEKAAAAISLNMRRLYRLCLRTLGHPPGVILDLARIVRLAQNLTHTPRTLKVIARAHGYPDEPTMSTQFLRFVGMRPGAYRGHPAHRTLSRNAIRLS